ncbi:DUF899 family protein [Verrucosispora sp. WMMD573]|uniref:DUF899 family protein n=1 Tax=Verrucosispora sp. WMMD573 TaxID=3015149 RepID=UPI00248CC00E|nr:DUF899 family protein [Verrucosispora sp. WMMD573]WBB53788.1 DUF899 family protein [Verrucosispora sp. WMMD573]
MDEATGPPPLPMWPVDADVGYVTARLRLAEAERRLRDEIERVAAARRELPLGALVADHALTEGPADLSAAGPLRAIRLSALFGAYRTLVVYHLMFHPDWQSACPMCSLWVDGFHGVAHHLRQRTAFVVIGKAPARALRAWGARRGWDGLRLLSSHGTDFNADLRAEYRNGDQRPMISVLVRTDDGVRHFYSQPANFVDGAERGIDLLSPVWNVLDLLPDGRGDWYAGNTYPRLTGLTEPTDRPM